MGLQRLRSLFIVGWGTELGFIQVSLSQGAYHKADMTKFIALVLAFLIRVEVYGLDVLKAFLVCLYDARYCSLQV